MVQEWSVPAWAVLTTLGVLLLLVVVLVVLTARSRARAAGLQARVASVEERLAVLVGEPTPASAPDPAPRTEEYVITRVGDAPAAPSPAAAPATETVPAPLFADLVLRESVVQAASFTAGLRRALSAETRNRIRFEVRREVKRSRRQRRAELKQARRAWEARQRAGLDESSAA